MWTDRHFILIVPSLHAFCAEKMNKGSTEIKHALRSRGLHIHLF